MAKYAILKSFYASEAWIRFRLAIIAERGLRCEHCGRIVSKARDLTLHHKIELTPENVSDVMISLNPDNVMVVHHDCHNKIHGRFGYTIEKGVYVVYGPPLAGKHTWISEHISRGDMVVDMDRLYRAISFRPSFDKPDNLLMNVRGVYNLLIDNVKTRYGRWNSAFVVTGGADKYQRERLAEDLGAELVFCDTSIEECIRRLEADKDRRYRQDEWRGYINKWFEAYTV
jgi:DNA-directed RNA polymerase subunit RPC12/RpoP/predicted kinase